MDNCWDYHDGKSEIRMGKALHDGYREKVFLMTKIDGRTKKAAAEQIDESLSACKPTMIDLIQFHEIIRLDDPDRIFADGGALRSGAGREEGRQDSLHWLHRAQGPADPSAHAGSGRGSMSFHFDTARCR